MFTITVCNIPYRTGWMLQNSNSTELHYVINIADCI